MADQPNLNQNRKDIMDIAAMTEETFRSVAANIQDMFANALDASDTVVRSFQKDISNSIKNVARESSKLADNFEKMNRGALKQSDIQKQLEARAAKIRSIEVSIESLRRRGTAESIEQANELNKQYQDLVSINDDYTEKLKEQIQILNKADKEIGLLGSGIKGLGNFLGKLGFDGLAKPLESAIENTRAYKIQLIQAQDEYSKLINKSEELTEEEQKRKEELESEIKILERKQGRLRNIASSLKEQLTLTNMTDAILGKVVKSFFDLDEAQTKFKNLTGGQIPIMDQFNTRLITSVDYIKTASSLTEQLGVNAAAVFSPDTLASASEMVKSMGMTQEQANKAAIWSQATGVSIDDMNKSLKEGNKQYNQQNRSALAQGAIMREVYNTSTAIAASMGNSVDKIGDAVRRAKDLGLSLQEVEGVANSLLDIESSIASEFEYEVISGKQINLEAARYYALTNQYGKLTEEIANNQAIIQSFASGNRIEQEAAAKALGISRDQLAEMYMASLRKQGLDDKAIATAMQMDEMDVKRQTVQESINTSIAKMTELLAGPLQAFTSLIDNAWVLKGIMVAIGGVIMTQMVLGVIEMGKGLILAIPKLATILGLESGIAAAKISGAMAATVGLGAIAILGGIAAGIGALISATSQAKSSSIKDGIIDPKKGPIVSGEFGTVQLNPRDSIVAGTNLLGNNKKSEPIIITQPSQPVQQVPQIDYDKMALAMSRVKVQTNLDGVRISSELQKAPMGIATRKI